MPPHSICEWMIGQNFTTKKKPNRLRHVVSLEVLTDDESGADLYKIAVPRGRPAAPRKARVASKLPKSSLKKPPDIIAEPEAETSLDASEDTGGGETSDEELDLTCSCSKCVRGQEKLNHMKQTKGKKKAAIVAAASPASTSEEDGEDDAAAVVHMKHEAKKQKKKVSFADTTSEESKSDASPADVKHQAKREKKNAVAVVSVSPGDENESESSVVEAKVEAKQGKKGSLSMSVALSSEDESESEVSVAQPKSKKWQAKKASGTTTPESSTGESDGNTSPAPMKQQAKSKKTRSEKPPEIEEDTPKDTKSARKGTTRNAKKRVEPTTSETESGDSSADDTPSETEDDTEEDAKVQRTQKGKRKSKSADRKKDKQGKAESKKAHKNKIRRKISRGKAAPDPESESMSETEPESEVEVEVKAPKKTKSKKSKTVSFPPARPGPDMRRPNLLFPPRASVMQVEHAVEVPQDPRPNAFYDNDSGTMRVYHGPAYGNPYGMLYPKHVYDYQNLPVGVPHPTQNPWYNGFPPVNNRPAPPHVPPQGGAIDETNPWFRGWGTVGPVPIPDNMPPPPDFTAEKDKSNRKGHGERHGLSPPGSHISKDRDAGWDSNVVPFPSIEVTAPDGSPAKGSGPWETGSTSGSPWGAQGAPGSKKSPEKQAENKKKKKDVVVDDVNDFDAVFNDKLTGIGKALQEAAARDSADLRAREERWSNRSGSSKEPSPQPSSGWDNTAKKTSINGNKDGWGAGAENRNGWGNNNGGGNLWDAGNSKTGDNSTWDNGWGNGEKKNSWDNANTNNSDNGWGNNNNTSEWDSKNDNGEWSARANNWEWDDDIKNGGLSNTNITSKNKDKDNKKDNAWAPVAPPSSPLPKNAKPIPGTWASPVPSRVPSNGSVDNMGRRPSPPNKGRGKEKAKEKAKGKEKVVGFEGGWGDSTLAQSSGGYWNTEEGQADIAKGANGSWW